MQARNVLVGGRRISKALLSVRAPLNEGAVNPTAVPLPGRLELEDELVEVQVLLYPKRQLVACCRGYGDISRLPLNMLRVRGAANRPIQLGTAISARRKKGAELSPNRLQHVGRKGCERSEDTRIVGVVVDILAQCIVAVD